MRSAHGASGPAPSMPSLAVSPHPLTDAAGRLLCEPGAAVVPLGRRAHVPGGGGAVGGAEPGGGQGGGGTGPEMEQLRVDWPPCVTLTHAQAISAVTWPALQRVQLLCMSASFPRNAIPGCAGRLQAGAGRDCASRLPAQRAVSALELPAAWPPSQDEGLASFPASPDTQRCSACYMIPRLWSPAHQPCPCRRSMMQSSTYNCAFWTMQKVDRAAAGAAADKPSCT